MFSAISAIATLTRSRQRALASAVRFWLLFFMTGPLLLLVFLADARDLPHGRSRAGDRHLKFLRDPGQRLDSSRKHDFGSIQDSVPEPGSMVSWHPSPVSLAKAQEAPTSAVPASYMQADYLDSFRGNAARGREIPGLLIPSWDIAGQCDIRAMTYVINAHLRRHDTYRSWFEYTDAGHIVRHTISDPTDIEFVPTAHGEMTPAEWRGSYLATPNPLQWDCFRFVIIQRADHFTFFVCVDHLHSRRDVYVRGIHRDPHDVRRPGGRRTTHPVGGSRAAISTTASGSERTLSALTLESPEIRQWIEFAENNGGTLPGFPLPLGDESAPADSVSAQLINERQTAGFESACIAAGARFSGGVFACAALAQYELTGAEIYYGITSVDNPPHPGRLHDGGLVHRPCSGRRPDHRIVLR